MKNKINMKIILIMVMSLDGKTTRWNEPDIYKWTSKEDQEYFASLINKEKLIIMGSKTFEAAKNNIRLSPDKLRIILTTKPEKYSDQSVRGQLEFVSDSPQNLIKRLEKEGIKRALLVGGETVNASFLKKGLVDELWLTLEPKMFGIGKSLISQEKIDASFKLKNIKRLNNKGTILLKYNLDNSGNMIQ